MGKSSKKSATKVDVAPAAIVPSKSAKKGKRAAEEIVEKKVTAKKQKKDEGVEQAVLKQKIDVKTQKKKKEETSSSEESDSEEEEAPVAKVVPSKKGPLATRNGAVAAPAKKNKPASSSSEDDSSDDSDSDSDEVPASKAAATKTTSAAVPAKKSKAASSSEDDSSDDDSDEDEEPKSKITEAKKLPVVAKNGPSTTPKGKVESSDDSSSDSDDSSDEEDVPLKPTPQAKKVPETSAKKEFGAVSKKSESSDSSSDEDDSSSDDEQKNRGSKSSTEVKKLPAKNVSAATKDESSDDSDSSSSDEDESDSDEDKTPPKAAVLSEKKESKQKAQDKMDVDSDESEDEEDSDDSDEEAQQPQKKKKVDTEAVSPKTATKQADPKSKNEAPKTPITPQGQNESKTLFVGNLSFQVEQADVENFFKDAGIPIDVRFASDHDGRFKGFAHVEFETAEAAKKAMDLNGQLLLNREVRLDLARERGAYTPNDSKDRNSFQKGGRGGQTHTIFVRGFDGNSGEDEVRSALQEHFGSCGEITRVSIPKDYESGNIKGISYIDFKDADSFKSALELNGSELHGQYLTVDEAKPRGDSRDSRDSSSFQRTRGRSGDGSGRFSSGRRGRGDFGRGGRSDFGRGRGGGRGNRPGITSSGKKTTFGDD